MAFVEVAGYDLALALAYPFGGGDILSLGMVILPAAAPTSNRGWGETAPCVLYFQLFHVFFCVCSCLSSRVISRMYFLTWSSEVTPVLGLVSLKQRYDNPESIACFIED